jgi:hypothetical protein
MSHRVRAWRPLRLTTNTLDDLARGTNPVVRGKSYDIPKMLVWDAWLKIKENGGAAGPPLRTVSTLTLSRSAIEALVRPAAARRTMLARRTSRWGRV